jgi:hypothetical protein
MSKKPLLEIDVKNWIGSKSKSTNWYVKQTFENTARKWYTLSIYEPTSPLYRFNVIVDRRIQSNGTLEVIVGIRRKNNTMNVYNKYFDVPVGYFTNGLSKFIDTYVLPMESMLDECINYKK